MRKIYIIFLTIWMFSCQKPLDKPANLLSEKEMSQILTDIYLYKQTPDNMPLRPEVAFDTYVSIFKKYNTTKEIFQDSFTYYYTKVKPMQHIYDETIENLKNKLSQEELKKLKDEKSKKEE